MRVVYNDGVWDNHLWIASAIMEYIGHKPHLKDLFDTTIIITKGIHATPTDRHHFTFVMRDITYHAYTTERHLSVVKDGQDQHKVIGCVINTISYITNLA